MDRCSRRAISLRLTLFLSSHAKRVRIAAEDAKIIGHQDAGNELHHQNPLGAVAFEYPWHENPVSAQRSADPLYVGSFETVIDLLTQDMLDFPVCLAPARMGHDGKRIEHGGNPLDEEQILVDGVGNEWALNLHRDPNLLVTKMRPMELSD